MDFNCPACDSDTPPTALGQLGRLLWFRCRDCGIDFNVTAGDDE